MLYELVYSSNATHDVENAMLESILTEARQKNTQNDVTGLLVFNGSSFFQLIEGNKKVIEQTFARIKEDRRHHNLSVFHSGEIKSRSFADWAMSYKRIDDAFAREGWLNWLESQILINNTSHVQSTGRQILRFVNNL
ncbi:MAG: BLUF domain-containing protein [Pseudomonadota bacterium]